MSTTIIEGIVYSIINNTANVGNYSETDQDHNALAEDNIDAKSIVLKPYVNGFPVRKILKYSFVRSQIEYIFIPKTVQTLGFDCLAYSPTLHSVIFESESQLEVMEQGVFHQSKNISRIVLPEKLHTITNYTFGNSGVKIIYYYGQAEINGDSIFLFETDKRVFPEKVYVCSNANFDHFGEFQDVQKILSCPSYHTCQTCKTNVISINKIYFIIYLFLTK